MDVIQTKTAKDYAREAAVCKVLHDAFERQGNVKAAERLKVKAIYNVARCLAVLADEMRLKGHVRNTPETS